MRVSLIVAAGGAGERFQKSLRRSRAKTPRRGENISGVLRSKISFPLKGESIFARALGAFKAVPQIREIIVAAPRRDIPSLRGLAAGFPRRVRWVCGGKTRAESVWNALKKTRETNPWVMVHDAARPLIDPEVIRKILRVARRGKKIDGVIAAKKVVPTIKRADKIGNIRTTVDRENLYEAETPQLVRRNLLVGAYRKNPDAFLATDESSLLESLGAKMKVLGHDGWNPKITTAKDYDLARAYVGARKENVMRTGLGKDTHRLAARRRFYLGGIEIPFEKGSLGHSDGDAVLHAVTDALLGAIGAGDIGDWFSDKDPKNKGVRSEKFLRRILSEALKRGFSPEHVDTVITLEKPKLGPYKKKIKKNIARILGLPEDSVSVKAKTAEGLGPEGEGRAVSCEAVMTVRGGRP
jgi:2-C-methyl-D-erythritol 4-phosphate cytidylyltransferase/2-C-methyl-D-erythritol 2,4-cyclodiphosphate synthase